MLSKIYLVKETGIVNILKMLLFLKKTNFILYRNSYIDIYPNAKINIAGSFKFNSKWSNKDPNKSFLIMRKNSRLEVNQFAIYSGANISINDNAILSLGSGYINHNVNIACFNKIEIGDNVAISENVSIRDSDNHKITTLKHIMTAPIKIEDDVWIGMNVIILKGVTIGEGSVIAAGSVVTRDIPQKSLAAGIPARVIKENVEWE